jgi:hypothetical protein
MSFSPLFSRRAFLLGACAIFGALLPACSFQSSGGAPHRPSAPSPSVPSTTGPNLPGSPPSPTAQGFARFYGVNYDLAGFESFAGADTPALLAALRPTTIRWPGGTEADTYDWLTGGDAKHPSAGFTLEDLAAACRATGAVPIFDLDVLAPANRSDPSDQISMLEAARRLGLPVEYVEIGNELYSNGPGFAKAFPDGAAYARTVSIYTRALHQAFPGVEVAADAIPFPEDRRERSWDAELEAEARGPGARDAFVVHFYPGLYQSPFTSSSLPALFENLYASISELSQAVDGLGRPVWLTEYNFRGPYKAFRAEGPPPAEGDYAHELYLAAFAAMLPRVPHLALVDAWTALGDGIYGAWQDGLPTPQPSGPGPGDDRRRRPGRRIGRADRCPWSSRFRSRQARCGRGALRAPWRDDDRTFGEPHRIPRPCAPRWLASCGCPLGTSDRRADSPLGRCQQPRLGGRWTKRPFPAPLVDHPRWGCTRPLDVVSTHVVYTRDRSFASQRRVCPVVIVRVDKCFQGVRSF